LALGTTDVTPLEMARAYATLANHGMRPEPLVVERVETASGEVLVEREPRLEQVLDRNVADTVAWILQQNIRSGTGTGARLPWPAMGKTGTAQSFSDASFAGATPELAAVVWMGFAPDPATGVIPTMENVRGRSVTGGSFPATIWRKFMTAALNGVEHSGFSTPTLSGEVMRPEPVDCTDPRYAALRPDIPEGEDGEGDDEGSAEQETGEVPGHLRGLECIEPSPEPTPSPCFVEAECPEGQEPTPTPSPSKTPDIGLDCFPFCGREDPRSPGPSPTPSKQPSPKATASPKPSPSESPGGTEEDCFPFCDTGDAGDDEEGDDG
ncbi:MAG: penicillin-binding transpeptidase domain-containing protein, partial [Actinomycetota bacterium]